MAWMGRSETGDEMRGRKSVLSSVTNQIPDIIVWYKPATRPPTTHSPFMPPLSATLTQPYPPSPNLYTLPPTTTNNCWQKRCLPRLGLIIASRLLPSREGNFSSRWTRNERGEIEQKAILRDIVDFKIDARSDAFLIAEGERGQRLGGRGKGWRK